MRNLSLGSLFSGSGGFELAGMMSGIEPIWASEVEPFCIRVTTKRLPAVKHLGDVNNINGATIQPADIITFGSPCQNLSVAGNRTGLHGERSGLFFHATRIIREMRQATNGEYPKYAVMENVLGMYSSNDGRDFLEVLSELCHTKDETISIPMPENGRWSTAGEIVGDGFSLAWRTLDAQYWGVPQRRRRCYIVVDFTGERAGKILFDESRLSRDLTPCEGAREGTAGGIAAGAGGSGGVAFAFEPGASSRLGGHVWENVTGTLRADAGDNQTAVVYDARGNGDGAVTAFGICSKASYSMMSSNPHAGIYEATTARTLDTSVSDPNKNAGGIAIVAIEGNGIRPSHKGSGIGEDGVSFTLNTVERHAVCYSDVVGSLCATEYKFPQNQAVESGKAIVEQYDNRYTVRRLTPSECAMLQGLCRAGNYAKLAAKR